jgi:hypothetical protein
MNSTPTNVPEAPILPQTCARKPWDRKIWCAPSCSITEPIPTGAIYRISQVSEETGGEEMLPPPTTPHLASSRLASPTATATATATAQPSPAGSGGGAHTCVVVVSFFQLLNIDGIISNI